jgi:hypothetical protein
MGGEREKGEGGRDGERGRGGEAEMDLYICIYIKRDK